MWPRLVPRFASRPPAHKTTEGPQGRIRKEREKNSHSLATAAATATDIVTAATKRNEINRESGQMLIIINSP